MAVSGSASGTDGRAALAVLLLMGLIAAPFVHMSCAAKKDKAADLAEATADDEADEDDETDDNGLPHPKRATAWHTRTLVTTVAQPSADKIAGCIEQVDTVAAEAGNQDDLRTAPNGLRALAAADAQLYHFCFYQMAARLDERLASGGPVMSNLADKFFEGMKSLWILARALDLATNQDRYFPYVQTRYLQLSRDYFGRDVQVVGPPLGGGEPPAAKTTPKPQGPAPAH